MEKTKFELMFELDIKTHTEELKTGTGFNPTYLSWSSAILLANQNYEGFMFRFIYNEDGTPVFYNELTDGFFVRTKVTIDKGETWTELSLPVLDNKFKPQGKDIRTYETKYGKKTVQPANSFDINYSQMRCLTKNISIVTGIGLKLYFKEGLNEALVRDKIEKEKEEELKKMVNEISEQIIKHPILENQKYKSWIENKLKLKLNKSMLLKQSKSKLADILKKLDESYKKQQEKETKE